MNRIVLWTIIFILVATATGIFFLIDFKFDDDLSNATPSPSPSPRPVVKAATHPALGKYLTDSEGITLYVFADDPTDGAIISKCQDTEIDDCARTWPPYTYDYGDKSEIVDWKVDPLTRKVSLFKRSTGALQYVYRLNPVYYYVGDEKPGDVNGHGIDGKWSLIFLEN